MLKIYGVLNSRASRNVWLAQELQLDFEHIPVVQASRLEDPYAGDAPLNTASETFRRISQLRQIPVVDDGGLILHESLAINLHLAQKSPGHPLAPQDATEEALVTMWTLWAATECEAHGVGIIVNRAVRHPEDRDEHAVRRAVAALDAPLRLLAAAIVAGDGHPVGGRFTTADLNIAEVLRYAQPAGELFNRHPVVADWLARCQSRPAYCEVAARRAAEALPSAWRNAYRPKAKATGG
jgi:glutathione S-transferase